MQCHETVHEPDCDRVAIAQTKQQFGGEENLHNVSELVLESRKSK